MLNEQSISVLCYLEQCYLSPWYLFINQECGPLCGYILNTHFSIGVGIILFGTNIEPNYYSVSWPNPTEVIVYIACLSCRQINILLLLCSRWLCMLPFKDNNDHLILIIIISVRKPQKSQMRRRTAKQQNTLHEDCTFLHML